MSDSVKSTVLNGAGQAFYNNGREPTGNRSISGNEIQHVEAATQRLQSSKQNQRLDTLSCWTFIGEIQRQSTPAALSTCALSIKIKPLL